MKISVKKHLMLLRVSWNGSRPRSKFALLAFLSRTLTSPYHRAPEFFFPFESAYFQELMMFSDKSFPTCAFRLLSVTGRIIAQGNGRWTLFLRES